MLVGGKAFNLLKLAALGFPVPPGFVLPTSLCADWLSDVPPSSDAFRTLVAGPLDRLERASELGFGDPRRPLVVSVRSGAPISMPGMLNTVLDVGLTRATLPGFVGLTGNPRLAWDCYLRLIESYAENVQGLDRASFTGALDKAMAKAGATSKSDLCTLALRDLAAEYVDIFEAAAGKAFPDDPHQQLFAAVDAVFRSWNAAPAKSYRRLNALEGLPGTAVTVQRMVFGNAGPRSGAGVGFTRDPATGEKRLYVDFAFDAQGEDVVSGRRRLAPTAVLPRLMPEVDRALETLAHRLEQTFRDAQDFEFTVEEGELFLLQTRDAKRSAWAQLKVAVAMAREGLISPEEALQRLNSLDLSALIRRSVIGGTNRIVAHGTPAGPGVATGSIAFSVEAACARAARGERVILVRRDIATEDIDGIASATGVLTMCGGRTSHAAVVARELGKTAIVGCGSLQIANDETHCVIDGHLFKNGAEITLDGETGAIHVGAVEVRETRPDDELAQIETWKTQVSAASRAPRTNA